MALAAVKDDETFDDLTDGFHLVIDALKKNGINTIYKRDLAYPLPILDG